MQGATGRDRGAGRGVGAPATAVDAELMAVDAEVEHLNQVIGGVGLEGCPVTAAMTSTTSGSPLASRSGCSTPISSAPTGPRWVAAPPR
jgi:hypothetical protein